MTLERWLQQIDKSLPLFATAVVETCHQTSGWTTWDEKWRASRCWSHIQNHFSGCIYGPVRRCFTFSYLLPTSECWQSSLMQHECISPACCENGRVEYFYMCVFGSLNSDAVDVLALEHVSMCVNVREDTGRRNWLHSRTTAVISVRFQPDNEMKMLHFILSFAVMFVGTVVFPAAEFKWPPAVKQQKKTKTQICSASVNSPRTFLCCSLTFWFWMMCRKLCL